jgi:hypothetical protein
VDYHYEQERGGRYHQVFTGISFYGPEGEANLKRLGNRWTGLGNGLNFSDFYPEKTFAGFAVAVTADGIVRLDLCYAGQHGELDNVDNVCKKLESNTREYVVAEIVVDPSSTIYGFEVTSFGVRDSYH